MKKILLLFAAMCCMMVANAANLDATKIEYETGKFMYFILDETNHTATVTWGGLHGWYGTEDYIGSIAIPSKVNYGDTQYSVTSIGKCAFAYCELSSVDIPQGVTCIEDEAFCNCQNLITINLPEGLVSIGEQAFCECDYLTSVTLPSSVTVIGKNAFCECIGLTSITLPDGLKTIGEGAFDYCEKLESITIPSSVTSIGEYAFSDCPLLASISVDEDNTVYDSRNNCNAIIETATNTLIGGCSNTVIPSSVTAIDDYAFCGCGLTSITLPDGLKSIGEDTFAYCDNLASITIPSSVTEIGSYAFAYCDKLTTVTILNGMTSISDGTFCGCSNLASITIPSSVTSIGSYAFSSCSNLASITVKWTEAEKIPDITDYVFSDVNLSNVTLYVPGNTTALYQAKNVWKEFTNIVEWKNFTITKTDDTTIKQQVEDGDAVTIDESNRNIKSLEVLEEVENVGVTYTRNFANAGKWQAWYVPFDVPVEDMAQAGLDVAEIYGILLDKDNNAVIAFLKMDAGTVKANTPYVVRPKEYGDVTVTTTSTLYQTNATQFAISSAKDTYTIGGIYERTTTPGNWYAVNTDGQFQKMGTGVNLSPMRIWMTIDPRDDNPYTQPSEANARMKIMVIGDGETTGIETIDDGQLTIDNSQFYDLQGRKVTSFQKGQIYIVNGKKYMAK